MSKISIIVPIYKVEKYIKRCVDSLINQTFKDIEIILVDDGSPDNCAKICDEYLKKDNRIKVIHKKNEGLSMARNSGIIAAKSEYIGFVDGDDYVAQDMYEVLYKNIIDYKADISICGLFDCYKEKSILRYKKRQEISVLDNKTALKMALEGIKFSVNAVDKLYKKTLFDNIKFPEGKLSEDAFTIPKILSKASKVVFDSEPKYYYIHRDESITNSGFKKQDLNVIEAYEQNLEFVKNNFSDLIEQAETRLLWSYTCVLDKIILSKDFKNFKKYKKLLIILRKNTLKIILNRLFSIKRKAAMLILLFSPKLYKTLLIFQKRKIMKLKD